MRSSSFYQPPFPSPPPPPVPYFSSTSLTSCPELDLSITLSSVHTVEPGSPKKTQQICPSGHKLKLCPWAQAENNENTKLYYDEPLVVLSEPCTTKRTYPQQLVRAQRKNSGHLHAPIQPMEPSAVAPNQDQVSLERVELNTTLALKTELQSLEKVDFHKQMTIHDSLRKSERTKNLINTKASDVVNVSRSQLLYTSLVSVDVQEDQLISQVLQERLMFTPPIRCPGHKTEDAPSHLLFTPSFLIRQKPLPPEEAPVNGKPHPSTHHLHSFISTNIDML